MPTNIDFAGLGEAFLAGVESYNKLDDIRDKKELRKQQNEQFVLQKQQMEQQIKSNEIQQQISLNQLQEVQDKQYKAKFQEAIDAVGRNNFELFNNLGTDKNFVSRTGVVSLNPATLEDRKNIEDYIANQGKYALTTENQALIAKEADTKKYKVKVLNRQNNQHETRYLNDDEFNNHVLNFGLITPAQRREQAEQKKINEKLDIDKKKAEIGKLQAQTEISLKKPTKIGDDIYRYDESINDYVITKKGGGKDYLTNMIAAKIKEIEVPEYATKAVQILHDSTIPIDKKMGEIVKIAAKAQIELDANIDKKKMSQTTAEKIGEAKTVAEQMGSLVEMYNKNLVGASEFGVPAALMHLQGKYTGWLPKGMADFNSKHSSLILAAKHMEGMGASFTKNEEAMLSNLMPNPAEAESVYKEKFISYLSYLEKKANNIIKSTGAVPYSSGELEEFAKKISEVKEKAIKKFGIDPKTIKVPELDTSVSGKVGGKSYSEIGKPKNQSPTKPTNTITNTDALKQFLGGK